GDAGAETIHCGGVTPIGELALRCLAQRKIDKLRQDQESRARKQHRCPAKGQFVEVRRTGKPSGIGRRLTRHWALRGRNCRDQVRSPLVRAHWIAAQCTASLALGGAGLLASHQPTWY